VRAWVVIGALVGAGALGCRLGLRFAGFRRRHKLLGTGSLLLRTFVAIRAISFHHVDTTLRTSLVAFNASRALELAGILLIRHSPTMTLVITLRRSFQDFPVCSGGSGDAASSVTLMRNRARYGQTAKVPVTTRRSDARN
jgi:hypothetical protein